MKITTNRICAGEYVVTDGKKKINISRIDFGYGPEWVASCGSDSTDPLPTKRDAVFQAELWITEPA